MIAIVLNSILAAGLLTLVGLGKITWQECIAGLGLLVVPSAPHLIMSQKDPQ